MQTVYQNIDKYNRKVFSIFDVMIADLINIKKLNPVVAELFIRGRKLNFPIVLITLSYFKIPIDVKQNATQFFIMKILNKRGLQRIALNYLLDIDFKNFIEIYKKCTYSKCTYPYSFLVHDTTLLSDTSLRFKKNQVYNTLRMKNYNMILIEKPLKYLFHHQAKSVYTNIL